MPMTPPTIKLVLLACRAAVEAWHSAAIADSQNVVSQDRDSLVCRIASVGVKSAAAKPSPETVTILPPLIGAFDEVENEITAESYVKTAERVPKTV